jgi:beta-glucanase (GH16 family)
MKIAYSFIITFLLSSIALFSQQLPNDLDIIYTDLVWCDEFEETSLDTNKWFRQTFGPNGGGWYNGELQHYTDSNTNSFVSGGNLHIVAKKETTTQNGIRLNYTSARLNSKYTFTYGRVDVKAKLPSGNGTWPAIWTLGKNINEGGAYFQTQNFGTTNWPQCGEIDIMEHGLHATNTVSSALHTPSSNGNTINTATKSLPNVAKNFHIYSMNWSPNQITFMIDGNPYYTYKPSSKNTSTWPFDKDQFLLLNIAMGGFAGPPDANFTQSSMIIDYVRVYQNKTARKADASNSQLLIYPNEASKIISIKSDENIDR